MFCGENLSGYPSYLGPCSMHMMLLFKLNSSSCPSLSVGDDTKCPTKVDVSLKKITQTII